MSTYFTKDVTKETKMIWISNVLIIALFVAVGGTDKPNLFPYMRDITSNLYVALGNDTKVYKLSSVADMMNDTRRQIIFNPGLIFSGSHTRERSLICYITSLTYRTAVWDLYRYFNIRDLYVDNLEYEVGYLTQEIIHHYQAILEIYSIVNKRYIKLLNKNYGPISFVWFLYGNILEKSKIIIHLCNMLHELEEKFKKKRSKSVFAEYDDHSDSIGSKYESVGNTSMADKLKLDQLRIEAQKAKLARAQQKERKKYFKKFNKFGMTTRRKRKKKKGVWPLEYGWSIEDW